MWTSAVALFLLMSCATAPAFQLVSSGGTNLLIDPFLTENPATPAELKNLAAYKPHFILVTHSHGDHLGDAIALSKQHNAPIVAVNMPAIYQRDGLPDSLIRTVNVGGTVTLGDTTVHVVPAMHGSEPSGRVRRRPFGLSPGRHLDLRRHRCRPCRPRTKSAPPSATTAAYDS